MSPFFFFFNNNIHENSFINLSRIKWKKKKKFKVAASTKGSVFRTYLERDLVNFYEQDYFFIIEHSNGELTILNENLAFNSIIETKKITLILVYRNITKKINCYLEERDFKLNLSENVLNNLKSLNLKEKIEYYTFAFRPQNDTVITKIVSHDFPLILQGWYGEDLYLIKRFFENDFNDINEIYKTLNFNLILGLSFINISNWIKISLLRYIIEENSLNNFSRNKLSPYLPSHLRMDSSINQIISTSLIEFSNFSIEDCKKEFINIILLKSANCCFINRIHFLLLGNRWRLSSTRILYISLNNIFICKDIGNNIIHQFNIKQIINFEIEGEFLHITFDNNEKWRIKSKNNLIIKSIFF